MTPYINTTPHMYVLWNSSPLMERFKIPVSFVLSTGK